MTIHKEGRVLLVALWGILFLICVLANSFNWPGLYFYIGFSSVIFLFFLQFFRNPKRTFALDDGKIIAPADGKIVVIEETEETEYYNDQRIQISIFMSPINVHINRMAMKGVIKYFKYHPGKYLVAWHPKSSTENERTTVVAENANGFSILMRQIAGAAARRICWYIKEGDTLDQCEEFGFIKFGSRVDVFLPVGTTVDVKIGDKTVGGKTVLASIN